MLSPGDTAPLFSLPDQNGQIHTLDESAGQWRVIYFYPKDDTPGCTQEACNFRDSMDTLTRAGIRVYGVSKDSVASHKRFAQKYDLNFTLLADPDTSTIKAYGAWQERSLYGKTFWGTARVTYIIDGEGITRHVFPKVTPKAHEQEVLQIVTELKNA